MPNSPHYSKLIDLIERLEAAIVIIGLGYVGLPLIKAFIEAGSTSLVSDVDTEKVESRNQGQRYTQ